MKKEDPELRKLNLFRVRGTRVRKSPGARIDRVSCRMIRVYLTNESFKQLEADENEKLCFGISDEFPGKLIIARAKDCQSRGYKSYFNSKNVFFTLRTHPLVVKHIFPKNEERFEPSTESLCVDSSGVKLIAFEWPGYEEFMNAKEGKVRTEEYDVPEPIVDDSPQVNLEAANTEQNQIINGVATTESDPDDQPLMDDEVPFDVDPESPDGEVAESIMESDDQSTDDDSVDSAEFNENNSEEPSLDQPDDSHEQNSEEGPVPINGINQDSTDKEILEIF